MNERDEQDTFIDPFEAKFRRLAVARRERDYAKKAADRAEKDYRELEAEIIADLENSSRRGSIKFDFGGDLGVIQFVAKKTIFGRIIDKDAAIESFEREARVEEMMGEKFESRRLNEYVKEKMENQQDLPPGVGYYERKFIQISEKDK